MSSFLALYRGRTVGEAQLVAVTTDPGVVAAFATRLLSGTPEEDDAADDPVLATIEQGRRQALRLIARDGAGVGAELAEAR